MQLIQSAHAPPPNGHYSQATAQHGLVFVSNQLPVGNPSVLPTSTVREQTMQALRNADAVLRAADSDIGHALLVTIYVARISDWAEVDSAFAEFLGEHRPARAVVPTGQPLHLGYGVALQVIASGR